MTPPEDKDYKILRDSDGAVKHIVLYNESDIERLVALRARLADDLEAYEGDS